MLDLPYALAVKDGREAIGQSICSQERNRKPIGIVVPCWSNYLNMWKALLGKIARQENHNDPRKVLHSILSRGLRASLANAKEVVRSSQARRESK